MMEGGPPSLNLPTLANIWDVTLLAAHSLELFLLDITAAIVVQDGENLLHVLGGLLGKATHLEELLGAEAIWCCRRRESRVRDKMIMISIYRNNPLFSCSKHIMSNIIKVLHTFRDMVLSVMSPSCPNSQNGYAEASEFL